MKLHYVILFTGFWLTLGCAGTKSSTTTNIPDSHTLFTEVAAGSISLPACTSRVFPKKYKVFKVDYDSLRSLLLKPDPTPRILTHDTLVIELPMPDMGPRRYQISRVRVMPPELEEKFPDIRTYSGLNVQNKSETIRLDIAPKGLSVMILDSQGTILIDPYCKDDTLHVICFYKSALPEGVKQDFEH